VTLALTIQVTPEADLHQLGAIRISGLILCAILAGSAVVCLAWVAIQYQHRVVQNSQPFFLIMLCVGVLILSSTILPLSIDDEVCDSLSGCDHACMASPWLLSIGFVICFSALFSKIWRVNRIFRQKDIKRLVVTIHDALLPLTVLFIANFICLLTWTVFDPLVWKRKQINDYESYGYCGPTNGIGTIIFSTLILAINITALLLACFEAYRARMISDEYSETRYIAMTIISMLQVSAIGVPVMFLIMDNPPALFFVRSGLIFMIGMSVLLLVMLPKIYYFLHYQQHRAQKSKSQLKSILVNARSGVGKRTASDPSTDGIVTASDTEDGPGAEEMPGVRLMRLEARPCSGSMAQQQKKRPPSSPPMEQAPHNPGHQRRMEMLEQILADHNIDIDTEMRKKSSHSIRRAIPIPTPQLKPMDTFASYESTPDVASDSPCRSEVDYGYGDDRAQSFDDDEESVPTKDQTDHDHLQHQLHKVWLRQGRD
jgi:hypothetical protein